VTVKVRVFTTLGDHQEFDLQCCNVTPIELVSRFVGHLKSEFPGNEFQVVKLAGKKQRYNVIPLSLGNA